MSIIKISFSFYMVMLKKLQEINYLFQFADVTFDSDALCIAKEKANGGSDCTVRK